MSMRPTLCAIYQSNLPRILILLMGNKYSENTMRTNNESVRYHFILDESNARRKSVGKPESQRYRTEARQHVMRGVGSSRRKANKPKPVVFKLVPRRHTVADDAQELQSLSLEDKNSWNDVDGSTSAQQYDNHNLAVMTPPETPMEGPCRYGQPSSSPIQSIAQNDYRLDPFTRWAVDMTPRMRFLMNYGTFDRLGP